MLIRVMILKSPTIECLHLKKIATFKPKSFIRLQTFLFELVEVGLRMLGGLADSQHVNQGGMRYFNPQTSHVLHRAWFLMH